MATQIEEYEQIDALRVQGMNLAEKKCHKLCMEKMSGHPSWQLPVQRLWPGQQ